MQNKFQEVMSFLQFEIVDGRVICLYRCSTGPTQALGCDTWQQQHLSNQISIIYWTQISEITTINYCIGWSSTIHFCRNCIGNYCSSNYLLSTSGPTVCVPQKCVPQCRKTQWWGPFSSLFFI